jgi:Fe-S-cluster containining protein
MAQQADLEWGQLTKTATRHESQANAWFLPFPCIFHAQQSCSIYEARPFACRTFPLLNYLLEGKYYIAVNVQCEYGSDIYRHALEEIAKRQSRPG